MQDGSVGCPETDRVCCAHFWDAKPVINRYIGWNPRVVDWLLEKTEPVNYCVDRHPFRSRAVHSRDSVSWKNNEATREASQVSFPSSSPRARTRLAYRFAQPENFLPTCPVRYLCTTKGYVFDNERRTAWTTWRVISILICNHFNHDAIKSGEQVVWGLKLFPLKIKKKRYTDGRSNIWSTLSLWKK